MNTKQRWMYLFVSSSVLCACAAVNAQQYSHEIQELRATRCELLDAEVQCRAEFTAFIRLVDEACRQATNGEVRVKATEENYQRLNKHIQEGADMDTAMRMLIAEAIARKQEGRSSHGKRSAFCCFW